MTTRITISKIEDVEFGANLPAFDHAHAHHAALVGRAVAVEAAAPHAEGLKLLDAAQVGARGDEEDEGRDEVTGDGHGASRARVGQPINGKYGPAL